MTESATLTPTAWTADDSTFGARLALVRQRKAWGNVKEAALACGLPAQSWRTWERDGVMPRSQTYFDICARVARASGCDYGWLVDRRPTGASISPHDTGRNNPCYYGGRVILGPWLNKLLIDAA